MRITMLSGGVGGARMAAGFAALEGVELRVVVNVGDDEEVHSLHVSPDLDTVVYTLADVHGTEGWGRRGDTWQVMEELARFPVDTTFRLGDRDLATNLYRTTRLREGAALSQVTREVCEAFGLETEVLPASDDRVRTRLRVAETGEWLDFQTYFVVRVHRDTVDAVEVAGVEAAQPAPGVITALREADLVVIGPSNPILSIRPILEVPGIEEALRATPRVVAVSPLIGGAALKGPAAEVLASLGLPPGNAGVAAAYRGLVTDLVVDHADGGADLPEMRILVTDIRIPDRDRAARLAEEVVRWAH